jgi:hypothetical protein
VRNAAQPAAKAKQPAAKPAAAKAKQPAAKPAAAKAKQPAAKPAAAKAKQPAAKPAAAKASGAGTKDRPWQLLTPPGSSSFEAYRDPAAAPPALVVRVGKTELRYHERCIAELHAMLVARGDWMLLGTADEQRPAAPDTVEAWGRATSNPVGGWYGLKRGLRGRFGMYVPPVLEALGLAEVEHNPRNNRMRALGK